MSKKHHETEPGAWTSKVALSTKKLTVGCAEVTDARNKEAQTGQVTTDTSLMGHISRIHDLDQNASVIKGVAEENYLDASGKKTHTPQQ